MRSISERFFKKKKELPIFENPAGRPKKEVDPQVLLHLKDIGRSNREIARLMKISEATVRRRLKEFSPSE